MGGELRAEETQREACAYQPWVREGWIYQVCHCELVFGATAYDVPVIMCAFISSLYCCCCFKDARSVSVYPYEWSQILLSILNKLTFRKTVQNVVTNNVFLDKKSIKKTTTTQPKNKHKNPCWSQKLIPGPLALIVDAYPCTTESTESNNCSQAI